MRDRLAYSAENCSLGRTLDLVGERWTLLVLREALLGLRRFDDFVMELGCARNLLAARLTKLVEHGLLERRAYREAGRRGRYEYGLTRRGLELATAVCALVQWGDRYLCDPEGPPLLVRHHGCGEAVRAVMLCETHGAVGPEAVSLRPGPGAIRRTIKAG